MEYKKKYEKYKCKYLNSKKWKVGGSNDLIDSEITLMSAHIDIYIDKWYVIPKNVYVLTLFKTENPTKCISNDIFKKIINNKETLKDILKETTEDKTDYIIYNPNDIIPNINLIFHHNTLTNTENLIYGMFNVNLENLKEYKDITLMDEIENNFNIGTKIKKEKVIEIIKKINYNKINIQLAFNEFMIADKYKKYFAEPENFELDEIKDEEDNKFMTMLLTLIYNNKYENQYEVSLNDYIKQLDNDKLNLIILTTCPHIKELFLETYNTKKEIPKSINKYYEKYLNENFVPIYELDMIEVRDVKQLLDIFEDYEKNEEEIKELIRENITINSLTKIRNAIRILIKGCLTKNCHQVLELLLDNINFSGENFESMLSNILELEKIDENEALIKFFKHDYWNKYTLHLGRTLYQKFERKINVWNVLLANHFELYNIETFYYSANNGKEYKTYINKILLENPNKTLSIEQQIKFIRTFYENSQYNFLNDIIKYDTILSAEIISKLNTFADIIVSNVDTTNLLKLLKELYGKYLYEIINNILFTNGIDIHKITNEQITDFIIGLDDIHHLDYFVFNIKKSNPNIDINYPNSKGYNIYSYTRITLECILYRTKRLISPYVENPWYTNILTLIIDEYNIRKKRYLEILSNLGFTDNGKILDVNLIPPEDANVQLTDPKPMIVDDIIKCYVIVLDNFSYFLN